MSISTPHPASFIRTFVHCIIHSLFKYISITLTLQLLLSANAQADCTATGQNSSISIPTQNVLPSLPVGSQIGSDYVSSFVKQFNCGPRKPDNSLEGYGAGFQIMAPLVTSINNRNVYATNIAGIGFAVGYSGGFQCAASYVLWADQYTVSGRRQVCSGVDMSLLDNTWAKFYIALYKTSAQTGNGKLNLSGIISSVVKNTSTDWQKNLNVELLANQPQINSSVCSVLNISPNPVSLPAIVSRQLAAVGSRAGETTFNININCSGATNLYLTFTDMNNIGQTGSILSLDSSSTVQGVGLQLGYNGSIVAFGPDASTAGNTNQFFLNTFTGQQSFPFTVSYIRTGAISPGRLSATATFTFSYQ